MFSFWLLAKMPPLYPCCCCCQFLLWGVFVANIFIFLCFDFIEISVHVLCFKNLHSLFSRFGANHCCPAPPPQAGAGAGCQCIFLHYLHFSIFHFLQFLQYLNYFNNFYGIEILPLLFFCILSGLRISSTVSPLHSRVSWDLDFFLTVFFSPYIFVVENDNNEQRFLAPNLWGFVSPDPRTPFRPRGWSC